MKILIDSLKQVVNVKSYKQLQAEAKKNKFCAEVLIALNKKISNRNKVSYVNQKVQSLVVDNNFVITSTKFTSTKSFIDEVLLSATEVLKLRKLNLTYDNFKKLFAFVSKFILCNYNTKLNLCKHERFYSQCLQQVNLVLNKFTKDVMMSRSSKIKVQQITFDNITKKHNEIMKLLFDKTKSKTSKLVKAKSIKTKKVIV